jgi:tetratricopeptide (TPR) repeat protein
MAYATKLQAARKQLGYSAAETIALLTRRAATHNIPIMSATSLKTKLSRWENGREGVGLPEYRRLFREIYGRTSEELGFPPEHIDTEAEELRARLAAARTIDTATIASFRQQLEHTRRIDRQFGGLTQLDQLRHHMDQVNRLLEYSLGGHRAELAAVLGDAAALAGWLALDRNAHDQAWQHYERATLAAREAGSIPLLAHAIAGKAFVLIELGETAAAVQHAEHARSLAGPNESPLMRAWLAAAHGETLAAAAAGPDAQRSFDTAEQLLPAEARDPAMPYLFLADGHLQRWRGNALASLGDLEAIAHLEHALDQLPAEFVRARTSLTVDLARAHAAAGERDATLTYARQARRLANQIKSDRQLRRLDRLILPDTA